MNEIGRLYRVPSQKNIQDECESSAVVGAGFDGQKTSSSDHHSWLHSANHANSPIWHRVFSPTTLETITATLCRRRDCIDMNWDTDEEEEEEEEEEKEDENKTNAFMGCGELPTTLFYGDLRQDIHLAARSDCTENTISNRWNRHQATQTAFPALADLIDEQFPETIPHVCLPTSNTNRGCPVFVPMSSTSLAHNTWPLSPPPVSHPEDITSTTTSANYASVNRDCFDFLPHSSPQSTSVNDKQSVFSLRTTSCDDTVSSTGPPISTNTTPITLTVDELKASTDLESPVISPLLTFGQHDLFDSHLHRETQSSVFSMPLSTKLTVMNRPLFCGLTVPPIMEEEEEVSVDYDQSLLTNSMQQNTLDRSSPNAVRPVLMTPVEPIEEDYPLLRPDYTVK
ncbi:hypothetical protein P879_07112 [Paragonimus westermani]|uniref:Uncharacterized protein n=1 Tax=Paragonimus westermani TaxID=34504 RepID=A0A8T0DKK3_9TREM|nr:hypothetical protein P879_07112 [Paragonimus westermani]